MKNLTNLILMATICLSTACLAAEETGTVPSITNDTLKTIFSRKSVRHYTGKPVSKEDLRMLVRAGMAAPSARDKRPWRFIVITDEGILAKLADGLSNSRMIYEAKAAIVVCADVTHGLSGRENAYWIQDCSAASENILLAAESMGLGAVWTGVYPLIERVEHVQQVLQMSVNVYPLNVIAVGYPVGDEKPKNKYDASRIHWDRWTE